MSRPDPRQQAALSAAFAGAVDLSALAQRPAAPPAAPAGGGPAAPDAPASQYVVPVTEADFGDIVQVSAQVPVVFDLWTSRSPVSAQLSPILAALADRGNGAWLLAQVDVDRNPRIAEAFQVQQIPAVIALAEGRPVALYGDAIGEPQLAQWISSLLDALRDRLPGIRAAEEAAGGPAPEPVDPRFVAAEELLEQGDFAGAQAAYRKILDSEPANAQAQAAWGHASLFARVDAHPDDAVALADAEPDNIDLQLAAADVDAAGGNAAAAFDRLIAVVRRTAGDERTAAREHLVGLFGLFPADDEAVRTARRALAAALY